MQNENSSRIVDLSRSEIRNMSNECDRVGGINLSQGICDFPLEKILIDGVQNALLEGVNHYTRHDGLECLRNAISKKAKEYNNFNADSEKEIVVTSGATGAFYSACFALLSPGDEVVLFEPFYGYHEYTLKALGLIPVYVKLSPPYWEIDFNVLSEAISQNTKGIMINTPLNPSGKVFSEEEINQLKDICIKHDLIAFTDEIYEYILYDDNRHISPASKNKLKDRTITISGYSKTFSITGWRIGYCIANENFSKEIGYASDLIYVCAPAPFQMAVANAINKLENDYYNNLKQKFLKKRDLICSMLKSIDLHPYIPQGAYYVLADITRLPGSNSKEKAMWLLEKTGVAVVPGSSFYHNPKDGDNIARFCFAKEDKVLYEACERLNVLKL